MNKMIVANWKMNGSFDLLESFLESINDEDFILALPNVFLGYANKKNDKTILAAQDCSVFDGFGAHTGETSAQLLKECGVRYLILGHSERRSTSKFDDVPSILKKLQNALDAGLQVILCVDENFDALLDGETKSLLKDRLSSITIAFEPLSAIGTGKTLSLKEIEDKLSQIKQKYFGIKTLYGGSVNSKNISDILQIQNLDGVLIGGASLKLNEIQDILNQKITLGC